VRNVLVDAGALIALLDKDDARHVRCVEALKQIREPLATVWPAMTEAMHLLADVPRAADALCDRVSEGAVHLLHLDAADVPRIKQLMRRYKDRPMDYADAAFVCVAERERLTTILTFDGDFAIYRLPGRARFTVLLLSTEPRRRDPRMVKLTI
jgi:predicted nucleic acid-binding protein